MNKDQLIKRRKALGYTQVTLAKALDLSLRQIGGMETGEREISKVMELAMKSLPKAPTK